MKKVRNHSFIFLFITIIILFFILKDIIGLILWLYPLMLGNSGNITVLLTNILYGINDVYGLINWNKMLKQQKTTV